MSRRSNADVLAARNALAYAQGYRGKGGGQSGAYASARKARAAGTPAPTDRTARPAQRQVVRTGSGAGRLVSPTKSGKGLGVVEAQLRGASRVHTIHATYRRANGQTQQVEVWSRGGWDASGLAGMVAAAGGIEGAIDSATVGQYGGDGLADEIEDGAAELVSFSLDLS